MSRQDTSINPRILESAKKEFLEHGFENASLQTICQSAGVTTGALYKRYASKAELFDVVVAPTLADIEVLKKAVSTRDYKLLDDNALVKMWDMSEEIHRYWIEYFYARYDGMKLLLCCSEGTDHADFLHEFVSENTQQSMKLVREVRKRGLPVNEIDQDELHILLTAYWSSIFETIVHDFSKEKALRYCGTISKFFNWQYFFGF